ncbi:hypothetical protein [Streptomyces sp. NPDC056796]|uniref:hypothetical protein n=1 Tax=Streptomyces sp. NPDC056796 TaxID=3345947 RepID=UPI00369108D5
MNSRARTAFALSVVTAGVLAAIPATAQAEPIGAGPVSDGFQTTAASLTALSWRSDGASRYVTVKNTYASRKCFKVDIPWRADPQFSIAANKTQEFRYGGALYFEGRKIYQVSC